MERQAKDPIVNLTYFTKRSTLFILLLSLTSGFIMASTINLLPFFLETKFDVSKGAAAAGTIPLAAASMIASLTGGMAAVSLMLTVVSLISISVAFGTHTMKRV